MLFKVDYSNVNILPVSTTQFININQLLRCESCGLDRHSDKNYAF